MSQKLTVADVMKTDPITVGPRDSLHMADLDMKYAAIRHLPVVDENSRVIGILSNRDILRGVGQGKKALVVAELMTQPCRTVRADVPAEEAVATLIQMKIGCLPVVDREDRLVGIVTETDFLMVAYEALRGQVRTAPHAQA